MGQRLNSKEPKLQPQVSDHFVDWTHIEGLGFGFSLVVLESTISKIYYDKSLTENDTSLLEIQTF